MEIPAPSQLEKLPLRAIVAYALLNANYLLESVPLDGGVDDAEAILAVAKRFVTRTAVVYDDDILALERAAALIRPPQEGHRLSSAVRARLCVCAVAMTVHFGIDAASQPEISSRCIHGAAREATRTASLATSLADYAIDDQRHASKRWQRLDAMGLSWRFKLVGAALVGFGDRQKNRLVATSPISAIS